MLDNNSMVIFNINGHYLFDYRKVYKMPNFRKYQYSNTIKIMMFFSNTKSYVPIKLCKTSGSIHLFKLTGSIKREDVTLYRNTIWDILYID